MKLSEILQRIVDNKMSVNLVFRAFQTICDTTYWTWNAKKFNEIHFENEWPMTVAVAEELLDLYNQLKPENKIIFDQSGIDIILDLLDYTKRYH